MTMDSNIDDLLDFIFRLDDITDFEPTVEECFSLDARFELILDDLLISSRRVV